MRVDRIERCHLVIRAHDRPRRRCFVGGDDRIDQRPEHCGKRGLGTGPGRYHIAKPQAMSRWWPQRIDALELGTEPCERDRRLLRLLRALQGVSDRRFGLGQGRGGSRGSGHLCRLLLKEFAPGPKPRDR